MGSGFKGSEVQRFKGLRANAEPGTQNVEPRTYERLRKVTLNGEPWTCERLNEKRKTE